MDPVEEESRCLLGNCNIMAPSCVMCYHLVSIVLPHGLSIIPQKAFLNRHFIKMIVIPDTVLSIQDSAFAGCTALESVTLPSKLTHIDTGTFKGCHRLKQIDIPATVTRIDDDAFRDTGLTSIDLPSGLTIIGRAAFGWSLCLNRIVVPGTVHTVGTLAFTACENLEVVVLEHGVRNVNDDAFFVCTKLHMVDIPDSITHIGQRAFAYCDMLSEIRLPSRLSIINAGVFFMCGSLERILIPDSVRVIDTGAFSHSAVRRVVIPSGLTRVGKQAFAHCYQLVSVVFSRAADEPVCEIDPCAVVACDNLLLVVLKSCTFRHGDTRPFCGCPKLETMTVSDIGSVLPLAPLPALKTVYGPPCTSLALFGASPQLRGINRCHVSVSRVASTLYWSVRCHARCTKDQRDGVVVVLQVAHRLKATAQLPCLPIEMWCEILSKLVREPKP